MCIQTIGYTKSDQTQSDRRISISFYSSEIRSKGLKGGSVSSSDTSSSGLVKLCTGFHATNTQLVNMRAIIPTKANPNMVLIT
jgi:hypothetical protein